MLEVFLSDLTLCLSKLAMEVKVNLPFFVFFQLRMLFFARVKNTQNIVLQSDKISIFHI